MLFRGRERLVRQRTGIVNARRSVLCEYGCVFPVSLVRLKRIATLLEDPGCGLPGPVVAECEDPLKQIAEKTEKITGRTAALKAPAAQTQTARCLRTMPGVGPMTALAVEAFAPTWRSSDADGTSRPGRVSSLVSTLLVGRRALAEYRKLARLISGGS